MMHHKHPLKKKIIYAVSAAVALLIVFVLVFYFNQNISSDVFYEISPSHTPAQPVALSYYIEIHNACNWDRRGTCVNMRNGAGKHFKVVEQLRNGVILKVGNIKEVDGVKWYKIIFTTELRYPERVEGDLYVAEGESVRYFETGEDQYATKVNATSTKRIVVDVSEETLYAYDGDALFMKEKISTGLEFTPTPRGKFFVLKKTPARYMQGPIPEVSDQFYDLPGVPWDLYFTNMGDVIHGAYWHNQFGKPWSHGCVNLPVDQAEKLYNWAEAGTPVIIKD